MKFTASLIGVVIALAGALIPLCRAQSTTTLAMPKWDPIYEALLTQANASVSEAAAIAADDPFRPVFHVLPAGQFMNDPNGPVWHAGRYHLFFQHLPFWTAGKDNRPMWGHASSADMVHWRHDPIALAPSPSGYDSGGIASGACVIKDGVPTIVYTGFTAKQVQCLATSNDAMLTWKKEPANPVLATMPTLEGLGDGFRDPCVWQEGSEWRMLLGSGFKGQGGTVLLYSSPDLRQWNFLGPLCIGLGTHCFQWECPAFFPIGNGSHYALMVSPLYDNITNLRGKVMVSVGTYANNRFVPGTWRPVDGGGETVYYAPNSFKDPAGRRILWGWIMAGREPAQKWCHSMSLPRIVSLGSNNELRYEPLPELKTLRRNEISLDATALQSESEIVVTQALGGHAEIEFNVKPGTAKQIELRFGRNADGSKFTSLIYDVAAGKIKFSDKETGFSLQPDEPELQIRLFIDGMVGEAYVNGRLCFSNVLPVDITATGVSLAAHGGSAALQRLSAWKMRSIWENNSSGVACNWLDARRNATSLP
jgi:beta-fructofuranosidase